MITSVVTTFPATSPVREAEDKEGAGKIKNGRYDRCALSGKAGRSLHRNRCSREGGGESGRRLRGLEHRFARALEGLGERAVSVVEIGGFLVRGEHLGKDHVRVVLPARCRVSGRRAR